jgi:long-chain acyl-CoA synthetase
MENCRKNIAKYAMPYDIEFRNELPKTLVGKINYRQLEEEEEKKVNYHATKDCEASRTLCP